MHTSRRHHCAPLTGSRHSSKPAQRVVRALAAACAVAMLAPAQAATRTWVGGAINGNWSAGANWQGAARPVNGDLLVFQGSQRLSNTDDLSALSVGGISFATGAGAFVMGGSQLLNSTGNIVNASSQLQTFNMGLVLGADQLWNGGSAGLLMKGAVNLGAYGLSVASEGAAQSITGIVSGTGGLAKTGSGMLVLAGANTFGGATRIDAGQVLLGNSLALQSSTVLLNVNNGLKLGSLGKATLGGLAGAGALDLGATEIVVGGNGQSTGYAGVIAGTGKLVKQGAGALTLSGLNSFTGMVQINAGQVVIGNSDALGGSNVILAVAGGLKLDSQLVRLGSLAGTGALDIGSGTLMVGQSHLPTTFSGGISGTGQLVKVGSGGMILSAASTFTGTTDVRDGVLQLANGLALQYSKVIASNNNGLELVTNTTLGSLGGPGNVATGARTLNVGGNGQDSSYAGSLQGDGAFNKTGAGTMTIRGTSTFSGELRISGGVLALAKGASLVNSRLQIEADNGLDLSQTSAVTFASLSGKGALDLVRTDLTVGSNGANTTYAGVIGGLATSRLVKVGKGALTLSAANTLGGVVEITEGSIALGNRLALQNAALFINVLDSLTVKPGLNLNGQTAVAIGLLGGSTTQAITLDSLTLTGYDGDANFKGSLNVRNTLTKQGLGVQVLSGDNVYTGKTLVSGGTLREVGGNSNAVITATDGGIFDSRNQTLSPLGGYGAITTLTGGEVDYNGSTVNGGFLAGSGHRIVGNGATFNGTVIRVGAVVTQKVEAELNDITLNGVLHSNAPLVWTGGVIGAGGLLNVNKTVAAASLVSNGVIRIGPGATLTSADTRLVLGAGSRTFLGSATVHGGELVVTGGSIELNGGLLVNNGAVTGTLNVNYGGTAQGAGTFGAVNVTTGGLFHPGNSPGTVYSSSATLGAGGALQFDINDAAGVAGANWSLWKVAGLLDVTAGNTANGRFTVQVNSLSADNTAGALAHFDAGQSYTWALWDASNVRGFAPTNFSVDASAFLNPLNGGRFDVIATGQGLALQFTSAVPEPGAWALWLAGLAGMAALGRRRRFVA